MIDTPRIRMLAGWLSIAGLCAHVSCTGGGAAVDGGAADAGAPLGLDEIPLRIAQTCPGDPDCPDQGDGALHAGYGVRDITPPLEPFVDGNGNDRWDEGEAFTDRDGTLTIPTTGITPDPHATVLAIDTR